eukprot:gnl/Spiro4/12025_TR6341_c0_g1_i1.p1 gnl/Spiro4/12025_TR6341_c0_g1~~gnl/Spiro4/12025_TR6341_c0_g1_i1.p1  ORF type:complete len:647 (+),score=223.06 gnl/Spiro4/12025_TR6341_c0_g1_i1:70-1941(+)
MCGIFAYILSVSGTPRGVVKTLLHGLAKLEYRGYDSAGVAVGKGDGTAFQVVKKEGRLANLKEACTSVTFDAPVMGISHTRWATHGAPSDVNSHPHLSNNREFAVVHNGVIENKEELKEELIELGYQFLSETDTEVVPMLLEHYSKPNRDGVKPPIEDVLVRALSKLQGAYGLAILSKNEHKIYGASLGSPLCIGIGENGEMFLASDPSAFIKYTNKVVHLMDGQICEITATSYTVKELKDEVAAPLPRPRSVVDIPYDIEDVRKGPYAHFMLKEIFDQPRALRNAVGGKLRQPSHFLHIRIPPTLHGITFLACGTSLYASMVGEYIIEDHVGIPVACESASEYTSRRCLLGNHDLAIAVSQSGQTADTRDALTHAKNAGAHVAGIVNVVGSQIARLAGNGMYLHAGPEIGVASTKAFTCQVAVMCLLARSLSRDIRFQQDITQALSDLPSVVEALLADQEMHQTVDAIANAFHNATNALYLGRGIDYPVALEGALKLKEISYIHAEGYAAGEMKHGPIALIDANMPVFCVIGSCPTNFQKVLSNMEEVKARRGRIITVCNKPLITPRIRELSDFVIGVPDTHICVAPVVKIIPLQLIAYRIAVLKNHDPDRPRNLAKSVTVV